MAIQIGNLQDQSRSTPFTHLVSIVGSANENITAVTITPIAGDSGITVDSNSLMISGSYVDDYSAELWYVEKGSSASSIGDMTYVVGLNNMPEGKDLIRLSTDPVGRIPKEYSISVTWNIVDPATGSVINQGVHTESKMQHVLNYNDEYYDWLKGYIERNNG